MIQVKNKTNKRITFPVLSFSIGPNEIKDVSEKIADVMLSYPSIVKLEKKEDRQSLKTKRQFKK